MKTLIVMPNYRLKDYYTFSLGIPYVSSYLKSKGHDISTLNANHYPGSKLGEILKANKFDVVATGGMFTHAEIIEDFIKNVRENSPQSKIVIGGPLASGDPQFTCEKLRPDYLVLGEGEQTMDGLLKALMSGSDIRKATGIAFYDNDNFVMTSPTPLISPIDSIPFPDYEGFEYGYYLDNYKEDTCSFQNIGGALYDRRNGVVTTTRDCVAKCTFCFRLMGGTYRARSQENVFKEIYYLREKYKINYIAFCDEMFASDKERVKSFCKELKLLGMPWRCQLRVNIAEEELLKTMKDAGCSAISYGFESASPRVLKSMKKGITPEQIDRAVSAAVTAKLTIQANFIFGDPAETIETAKETIKFSRKYKKFNLGFGSILPYPGTELYYNLIRDNKIDDRWEFYLKPGHKFYNMTSLSDFEFDYLQMKIGVEGHYRYRYSCGKVSSIRKVGKNTFNLNVGCQHCGELNSAKNFNPNVGMEIICKQCFQRIVINSSDIRFGSIAKMLREWYYALIVPLFILSPMTYRLSRPARKLFSELQKALKL
ncbi:MAG: radical SAM protein [Candidatus Omnitrophica bacterium]|nr:radical SAM protein [Candidatus Omnitrophota bacterium]